MLRLRSLQALLAWMVVLSVSRILAVDGALNKEGTALLRFKERVVNDPYGALSSWRENNVDANPCSWFGVECVEGSVISLKLKDLCLEGTLVPELVDLIHIKSIVLRNNSFWGIIPEDIGSLKELEELDLGYNNFSGPLPNEWGTNISILLLDNNGIFSHSSPELQNLMMISEVQVDESSLRPFEEVTPDNKKQKASSAAFDYMKDTLDLLTRHNSQSRDFTHDRGHMKLRLLEENKGAPKTSDSNQGRRVGPSPSDTEVTTSPLPSKNGVTTSPPPSVKRDNVRSSPSSPPESTISVPSPPITSSAAPSSGGSDGKKNAIIVSIAVGISVLLGIAILFGLWRSNRLSTVKPWRTGLSGPLQKSLVHGASKLKRSDIQAACEDFSNIIGSSSMGVLYKGTLSNGAEIAVLVHAVYSSKDWSSNLEAHFRKKVEASARLNHKNFLNLLGFCEEDQPFTRMLVFEYAPSGTLFEHLHVREAEHLDWNMRLRITMGVAYCLEQMHGLNPSSAHQNLTSFAVSLSEDYAAQLSDFSIWNEVALASGFEQPTIHDTNSPESSTKDNIHSFGLILLECVTGRVPFSTASSRSLEGWAVSYLRGEMNIRALVDPLLQQYDESQLEQIGEVIRYCTRQDPEERPVMGEVSSMLRVITGIGVDEAAPRVPSIWWAELA